MGNQSRSKSKPKKKTPPHQHGTSSSSGSGPAAPIRDIDSLLADLNRQLGDLTASRIASDAAYDRARRELAQALKEQDAALDAQERRALDAEKAELDAQRAEVRRVAEEAAERRRFLEDEVRQLRDRITEAKQLGHDYLLPTLEGQLQQLQPLVDDARREQGACRRELKLIQADLGLLTASKRLSDEDRRAYHAESQELARRSREWDALDGESRKLDAAWEKQYRRASAAEERLVQQEELPLELP